MNVCVAPDMYLGVAVRVPEEVCGVGGYLEAQEALRSLLTSASQCTADDSLSSPSPPWA